MKIAVRAVAAAALSTAVCWAATALLGASALGAVGAWLSNPWIIVASTVLVAIAGALLGGHFRARRRATSAARDDDSDQDKAPDHDKASGQDKASDQPAPDQVQPGR